jgi:RNA polymerase sigma-70 factor (ECF subfamily)
MTQARDPILRVVRATDPGPRPRTDDELLEGLIRGDQGLGSELCRRILGVVDATIYRTLGRREQDHDDLVQAALEQVVRTLSRGKFSRECSLTTWASAIACNIALHAIRRRRTERRIFDDSIDADQTAQRASGSDPESGVSSREELELVRLHLARMSERLANTLLLHDMLGCSLAETATILGVSMAAAQSRLVRGRKELSMRIERDRDRIVNGVGP